MTILIGMSIGLSKDATAQIAPPEYLALSTEQQNWLASNKTIRLGVDKDRPPLEFFNAQNTYSGLSADYIHLIEEYLSISFIVDAQQSLSANTAALINNELDMISAISRSPGNNKDFNYTRPYISLPIVIITQDNRPFVDSITMLGKARISIVGNSAAQGWLKNDYPDLSIQVEDTVLQGLISVSSGISDAFVGNRMVAEQVMLAASISNLKIAGPTPYYDGLGMAVRKDWPQLVSIIQKALDSISPAQHKQIYEQWIGQSAGEIPDYYNINGIIAGVSVLIVVFIVWYRKLKKHKHRRDLAERALQTKREELNISLHEAELSRMQMEEQATAMVGLAEDQVFLKAKAEKSELHNRTIINTVSDAIFTIDHHGLIETFNQAGTAIFGYTFNDIEHQPISGLIPELHETKDVGFMKITRDGSTETIVSKTREFIGIRKNGEEFPISLSLNAMPFNNKIKFTGVARDITAQKNAENEIKKLAMTDPLTGLANRNQFNQRLDEAISLGKRLGKRFALLIIDLDKFKPVNDTYGHPVGDTLLINVAEILQTLSRGTDTVARLGGDEFAVICTVIEQRDDVALPATRLVEEIQQAFTIDGHVIEIGASIGASIYPDDGTTMDDLIRKADLALYRAKNSGRNTYRLFDAKIDT